MRPRVMNPSRTATNVETETKIKASTSGKFGGNHFQSLDEPGLVYHRTKGLGIFFWGKQGFF